MFNERIFDFSKNDLHIKYLWGMLFEEEKKKKIIEDYGAIRSSFTFFIFFFTATIKFESAWICVHY